MNAENHGTRAAYAAGCRCKACCRANSAEVWARRHAQNWHSRLPLSLPAEGKPVPVCDIRGKPLVIPPDVLLEALKRHEKEVKVTALTMFRLGTRKAK